MPTQLVSVGQSCANALAAWFRKSLTPDVVVYDRWPEANVPLFAPPEPGGPPARAAVSVVKMGRRVKSDAWGIWQGQRLVAANGQTQIQLLFGGVEQPMQIDIWATTDVDRDDLIAQMDNVLYAGLPQTIGVYDDPVRDGILLALTDTNWTGYFADYWFDEPEIDDTPDSVQAAEYRATYFGEARTAFGQTVTVPEMTDLSVAIQSSTPPPGSGSTPYQIATLTPNPSPPPAGKVTYSTSSNP